MRKQITRRHFISTSAAIGGAMVLGFWLPPRCAQAAAILRRPWYTESTLPEVNAWLTIALDNTVTIRVGQTEMGTGVFTTCPMMIAEELQCDWQKVRAEYASPNRNFRERAPAWTLDVPGKGQYDPTGGGDIGEDPAAHPGIYRRLFTASSGAVRVGRYYMQYAGAEARERLLLAAAQKWGVQPSDLVAKEGVITHGPTGRQAMYGELAAAAARVRLAHPEKIKIKPPDLWTVMGTERQSLDAPLKVTGAAVYGIDVRLPAMLYAAVRACPVWGGDIKRYSADVVRHMPGVQAIVPLPRGGVFSGGPNKGEPILSSGGLAVVADSWWRAKRAVEAMPIEWDVGSHGQVSSESIYRDCLSSFDVPNRTVFDYGHYSSAISKAAKIVEATYALPYLAHVCMEPGNATAMVAADRVDLWVGDQDPDRALLEAAEITGVAPEKVFVHTTFLGGGFGARGGWGTTGALHNNQALLIAKALRGKPVKLLWTREEDLQVGDSYRPSGVAMFKAGLDADGWPIAMHVRTTGDNCYGPETRGLANPPYYVPNYLFEARLAHFHVPVGLRRGTGASVHAFYLETFIDELAHVARKDPYLYRRELISRNPPPPAEGIGGFRFRDDWLNALDTVVKMSGWGSPLPRGWGRGLAIDDRRRLEMKTATVCAHVHTVSVTPAGQLRLHRVDVVFDQGLGFVNPRSVRKQIEGSIAFGYDDALYQEVTIKDGRAVQSNFHEYPVSRIDEYPREVNISFLKTNRWIEGVGEEVMSGVAPAICNAVFQATGKRVRSLPLKHHDLKWS